MPKIDSKNARDKLPFRRDPYWQRIAPGVFVGYRVSALAGDGAWRGRARDADGKQQYRCIESIEFTPDKVGADTKFRQAEKIVRAWYAALEQGVVPQRLTVGEAVLKYLADKTMLTLEQIKASKHGDLCRQDRNIKKNLSVFERAIVADEIGKVHLDRLRSDLLTAWLRRQVDDIDPMEVEVLRAAKSTANRTWASFRAALNWAFEQRLIANDNAWRAVSRFDKATASREYIPSDDDIARLYAVASPEVIRVCQFLRHTGCRPGEAYSATVKSFDRAGKTLTISPDSKTGRRVVPLSSEAAEYLATLAVGKIEKALLLTRDDGKPWETAELNKRFRIARESAGFAFEFVPYSFRHLWITNACNALEVLHVGQASGTSVEMIQKHYAKLQPGRITAALDNMATLRARGTA